MKTLSVNCGDWHLGWGFGGDNKVGKLYLNEDNTYTWKGHSQGRYGQVWNKGSYVNFKMVEGEPDFGIEVIKAQGGYPRIFELKQGMRLLTIKNK